MINHRARWLIRCKARQPAANGRRPGAGGRPISGRLGALPPGPGRGGRDRGVAAARRTVPLRRPPRCTARRQSDGMIGHFWPDPLCAPTTGDDREGRSPPAPRRRHYGAPSRWRVGMLILSALFLFIIGFVRISHTSRADRRYSHRMHARMAPSLGPVIGRRASKIN